MTFLRAGLKSVANWLWLEEEDYRWLTLIVGVALAIRVVWVLVFQTAPVYDPKNYDILAWRLASGQGYVNADGESTAFWPVGFPAFLAAVYLVFGYSWTAAGIVNGFLGSISVLMTYRLAREVLSSQSSLVAAGVVALLPSQILSLTATLRSEVLHTVLTLIALIVMFRVMRSPTWKNAVLLGLLIGVSVYVRPILTLFPVLAAMLLILKGVRAKSAISLSAIMLGVMLIVLSPWTLRNFLVMGEFSLTATNGGYTFYIGNGPEATGRFTPINHFCKHCHMDISPSEVAARNVGFNEFYYYSELEQQYYGYRLGLEHIFNHPIQALSLLPVKFFYLWASDRYNIEPGIIPESYREIVPALRVIAQGYWTIIVIGAALAAISRPILGYWLRFPAALLPMTLLYWSVFHMMFHGEGRFHAQMIPVVIIVAAHLLDGERDWKAWLPERWRGRRDAAKLKGSI